MHLRISLDATPSPAKPISLISWWAIRNFPANFEAQASRCQFIWISKLGQTHSLCLQLSKSPLYACPPVTSSNLELDSRCNLTQLLPFLGAKVTPAFRFTSPSAPSKLPISWGWHSNHAPIARQQKFGFRLGGLLESEDARGLSSLPPLAGAIPQTPNYATALQPRNQSLMMKADVKADESVPSKTQFQRCRPISSLRRLPPKPCPKGSVIQSLLSMSTMVTHHSF